jgi:hypothetical protein
LPPVVGPPPPDEPPLGGVVGGGAPFEPLGSETLLGMLALPFSRHSNSYVAT